MSALPSLNEVLVPFLEALSSGQARSRAALRADLQAHFGAESEAERQGLVRLVGWCDVHFCKAGWVQKTQHPHDPAQDSFQLTPLGLREWLKGTARLKVGYLQSFYQSRILRGAGADDSTSEAEALLREKLEVLSPAYTVLQGVKWFAREHGTVGEIDFLIAHPCQGVLVLEVKGGAIQVENGQWYSTDRNGRTHAIQDPCTQAERNRRELQNWLAAHPRTKGVRLALFPAVALPDAQVQGDLRPDCPQAIFIDRRDLPQLEKRLETIFAYWQTHADQPNAQMGGQAAINALLTLLLPSRQFSPSLATLFEEEGRKIEALTEDQFNYLNFLAYHKRAAIMGGAGTGKTLLAMGKATRLAEEGLRVLLVCYNSNLAEWLKASLRHAGIEVFTFHQLVASMMKRAGTRLNPLRSRFFYEDAPEYLDSAADVLHAPGADRDKLYDAILVDEGQDFGETWWIGLQGCLKDRENGLFYVFFDDNQRIFKQLGDIPVQAPPFRLDKNLRNTQHIHERLRPYARAGTTQCVGPEGRPVEIYAVEEGSSTKQALQAALHRLVNEGKVSPQDIVILTPSAKDKSGWHEGLSLGNFRLTWDLKSTRPTDIRVSTIHSYKGLESAIVILTELKRLPKNTKDALLYVGLSRARHHVLVIGDLPSAVGGENPPE